ncbi:mannose-1-phosphate guanylyltransferase/mannose-6-phosphate isomerase, partial [Pseudoalteromonas sp. S3178]
LSRAHYPKQFLSLTGNEHTMLQQTLLRLQGIEHQPPLIICNEAHRFIAAEQVRQLNIPHSGILLEPEGK